MTLFPSRIAKFGNVHLLLLVVCLCLFCSMHFGVTEASWSDDNDRDLQESAGNPFIDFIILIFSFITNLLSGGNGQGRCEDQARCGLFGLFYVSITGIPGTAKCKESCVVVPPPIDQCGICGPVAPTISPAPIAPTNPPTSSPIKSAFDITIDFNLVPFFDRPDFIQAAKRWENVISGDLSNVSPGRQTPQYDGCSYPSSVDDVYVCARVSKNDGSGGILAFAGPDQQRGGDRGLPWSGFITFDEADIQNLRNRGTLNDVITHEIGHILGIGTLWSDFGIQGSGSSCPYTGSFANFEYKLLTGCTQVPAETDGGGQTRCVHFDNMCLQNELMTGFIDFDEPNLLSRVTVGSLEDLGFDVNYAGADSFARSIIPQSCLCSRRSLMGTTERPPKLSRKLSEEMRNYARTQGQAFLLEQAQRAVELSARDDESNADANFIGDKFVSVWVQDVDGNIYSVEVWADEGNL